MTLRGPLTKEEKADLERWREREAAFERERAELGKMLEETADDGIRKLIRSDIAHAERALQIIRQVLQD